MDTGCQSNNSISKRVGYNLFRFLNWKSQDNSHSILFICILSFLYQAKNYYTTFKADSFPTRFSIPLFLLLILIYLGRWIHRIITHHNSKQKQSHMCFKDEIESKHDQHDSIYCFSVYHHQRWLFPTGWNDLTHDRPAWYRAFVINK
jgi:Ca2+/H+ antiporter